MGDGVNGQSAASPLRRAFLKIEELEARVQADAAARREPLAIVGMGCRFPGDVTNPAALWDLLAAGRDATREIPVGRWDIAEYFDPEPGTPGKMYTARGGFLTDVDRFDAAFFGITPREAAQLDPQQRLLLEVTWEAIEHAGIAPSSLRGSRTGVYVGLATYDYAHRQIRSGNPAGCDAYFGTGTAASVASGRIAYTLGLHGPAITIDTACSSSLVALHLACRALRAGDCDSAIVGGVNLVLSPEAVISMCQSRMMATDGRCKTFDAAADGFGQAEGAAVVVVKRLSDAERDGDRILALVRGTAINQDGASSGLTAPNGPAQEAVIRDALADAALAPRDVAYVEAHGTGTELGDPIEVRALAAVYGEERPHDRPLLIGSIKTNLGHLEAAAGLAGLFKVVLSLQHQQIPAHLHFRNPNPLIPWHTLPVRVTDRATPLDDTFGRRVAGLSAFGFSGTNAHILIEEAPHAKEGSEVPARDRRPLQLLTLSARSDQALREQTASFEAHLRANPSERLEDVAYTANAGRFHGTHRLAMLAASASEVAEGLAAFATGRPASSVRHAVLETLEPPRVAFLFTGQGAQYHGMGRELFANEPVFRNAIEECETLFAHHLPGSICDLLLGRTDAQGANSAKLDLGLGTQPALFALQWGLLCLWRSWGITPGLVIGHGFGEYAAACASGVLSLADTVKLVAAQSQLLHTLEQPGAMATVLADESAVRARISRIPHVDLAAVNGPHSTEISGTEAGIAEAERQLGLAGIASIRLDMAHAFPSTLLDPILDEFQRVVETVPLADPSITMISSVTGQAVRRGEVTRSDYWRRQAREPVRFADGLRSAYAFGYRTFVELGPEPILSELAAQSLGDDCVIVSTLSKGSGAWPHLLETLRTLYLHGVPIDWAGFDRPHARRKLALPTYPFQRERYWIDEHPKAASSETRSEPGRGGATHPHLERRFDSAVGDTHFETHLDVQRHPYLADHVVHGVTVLPTAFYLEFIAAAVREHLDGAPVVLENVLIQEAVRVPSEGRDIQLILSPGATDTMQGGNGTFRLFVRDGERRWKPVVTGQFSGLPADPGRGSSPHRDDFLQPADGWSPVPLDDFYSVCRRIGLEFGPSFRGLTQLSRRDNEAVGQIDLPTGLAESRHFGLHPAALDACLQPLAAALPGFDPTQLETDVYMPIGIDRYEFLRPGGNRLISRVQLEPQTLTTAETHIGQGTIEDANGAIIARFTGLRMKRAPKAALAGNATISLDDCFYESQWELAPDLLANAQSAPEMVDRAAQAVALELRLAASTARHDLAAAADLWPPLDTACSAYVLGALAKLGWTPRLGQRITLAQIVEELGISSRHHRLMRRFVDFFIEDGILGPVDSSPANGAIQNLFTRSPESWMVIREPAPTDPDRAIDHLIERFPRMRPELLFAQRGGARLAEALLGQIEPTEILFPGGSFELADELYRKSPAALVFNELASEAVTRAVEAISAGRTIRFLEIGAGTGGVTSAVLPVLPTDRTKYVFTDLSATFFRKAASDFSAYPFLEFRVLDIERPPAEQGLADEGFDLVIASNVLHATADLGVALDHARSLLAPGGQLLILEGVQPRRWIDLSFGLTPGWWKFDDVALRAGYPLISVRKWRELLDAKDFTDTLIVPGHDRVASSGESRADSGHALILSRRMPASAPISPHRSVAEDFLIFADGRGAAESLRDQLRPLGAHCTLVDRADRFERLPDDRFQVDPTRVEDFRQLLQAQLEEGRSCGEIVYLWPVDCDITAEASASEVNAQVELCLKPLLGLLRALAESTGRQSPRLWIVTAGAQTVVDDEPINGLPQSAIWGMGKVIALEHPELHCVRIDLEHPNESGPLLAELTAGGDEPLVAYRGGQRYVSRLARVECPLASEPSAESETPLQLSIVERGTSAGVALRPAVRQVPAPGHVELKVHAAGLNFRDVLNVLGAREDEAPLGGEVAGIVIALGRGVEGIHVGDEVVAVTSGGLGTYATAPAELVLAKPATLDFATAAALPLAYLTAHYALDVIGRMAAGERILIHAAAGGVGLAAVELAKQAGLQIFATAGSPVKREFLQSIGVAHVFDSRSVAFADDVRRATNGEGVDLVLNSLTGPAIGASLSLLRSGGRFLEIGKAEILTPAQASVINPHAEYFAIDLAEQIACHPERVRPLFVETLGRVRDGLLPPLPVKTFPFTSAAEAIEHMARARHIGKVVLVPSSAADTFSVRPAGPRLLLKADATYLISGGLTGLGLATAEWLVERGARNILLFGRRAPSVEATATLQAMRARGANVVVAQADATCETDVRRLFEGPLRTLPPLRGVIHSAGRLEDGVLIQQDWPRFAQALGPKVGGAWLLHRLTIDFPLDFFVLYSSASALLGAPGQANHAAANAFLDELAHYRRARGLPALSINWGAWAQVGAAASRNVGQRIAKQGIGELTVDEGLQSLERAMLRGRPRIGVLRADWSRLSATHENPAERKFFAHLARNRIAATAAPTPTIPTAEKLNLRALPPDQRIGALLQLVRAQVASVIGLSSGDLVSDKQPLRDTGVDSLMAIELRNRLQIELGLERNLPATLVFDHPTVIALVEYLATEIFSPATPPETAATAAPDAGALDRIEQMSDEDIDRLFSQLSQKA